MTVRVLFVARYRDEVMDRRVLLLADQQDMSVCFAGPKHWQEDNAWFDRSNAAERPLQRLTVPMIGRVSDPHRALYRSMRFGMERFRPQIVYAEEEPDSLAALQIALAQRTVCPHAKLILYSWQNVDRPKRWYVRLVLQTTLRLSNAVICANTEGVQLLRRQGYTKPVELIPAYGVDTQIFKPEARRSSRERPFIVGYVGRLAPEKGIDTLISAFAQISREHGDGRHSHKSVELRIVGDGPERFLLEAQVNQLRVEDRVQFVGALSPLRVAEYIGQLDALVLPSRSTPVWQEQFGRVLVEAMACKVAVLGSSCGAIPEVIGDAGLIFPEGDAPALAASLRELVDNATLRRELAERGYRRVAAQYTQELVAERTAEFYRRVYRSR